MVVMVVFALLAGVFSTLLHYSASGLSFALNTRSALQVEENVVVGGNGVGENVVDGGYGDQKQKGINMSRVISMHAPHYFADGELDLPVDERLDIVPPECPRLDGVKRVAAAHHKTGDHLMWGVLGEVRDTFPTIEFNNHMTADALRMLEVNNIQLKVVHFIRDPLRVVLSGYFYHKDHHEEGWLDQPKVSKNFPENVRESLASRRFNWDRFSLRLPIPAYRHNESYRSYLQRVDLRAGLVAEVVRTFMVTFAEMRAAILTARARLDPCSYVAICLDPLMLCTNFPPDRYLRMWEYVARFWKVDFPSIKNKALSNSPIALSKTKKSLKQKTHATHSSNKTEALAVLREVDRSVFRGMIRDEGVLYQCNTPKCDY